VAARPTQSVPVNKTATPFLTSNAPTFNRLLGALPPDDYQRLAAGLEFRPLKLRQVLHKHGERFNEIFFPLRSVCSITNTVEDGGMVEVAAVGYEGFVGVPAVFGEPISTGDAFVQVQGEGAQVMTVETFRREMERRGPFYDLATKYSQAFVGLIMQSVACNGLHSAEERCCRWLLMTRDRVGQDHFPLTHEYLAMMLGVRRPTVTLVMADLVRAGIISHVRGQIRIADGPALEAASCECYRAVKQLFDRLLP